MRSPRLPNVLALAAALALPAAAEDLTIVSKVSGPIGAGGSSTQYFSSSKVRSTTAEGDLIFDVAAGTLTVIDHKKKEHWQTTLAELNTMMGALNDQMKQMQEQIKDTPMAAQVMERMMGGAAAAARLEKGPSPRRIAGYDCEHWIVAMGPQIKMELWTTAAIQPPTQFWDARRALSAANPMMQRYAAIFDELKKLKGFTLAESTSVSVMGRSSLTSSEASEVKRGPIPASAFEVPAGYKEVESPMKGAAEKMKGRPRG